LGTFIPITGVTTQGKGKPHNQSEGFPKKRREGKNFKKRPQASKRPCSSKNRVALKQAKAPFIGENRRQGKRQKIQRKKKKGNKNPCGVDIGHKQRVEKKTGHGRDSTRRCGEKEKQRAQEEVSGNYCSPWKRQGGEG